MPSRSPGASDRPTWVFSTHDDGDFAPDAPAVDRRRRALLADAGGPDEPWNWLRQVHGARVVTASEPGEHRGTEADALVTTSPMVPIAVQAADCGVVLFSSPEGVVGAAHAGWRGLVAGIVAATVEAMRGLGARRVDARIGPMIHPECYEFGTDDLAVVVAQLGPEVAGRTADGSSALDLPNAVERAVLDAGATVAMRSPGCTACTPERWYSHRARIETARMTAVVWLERGT